MSVLTAALLATAARAAGVRRVAGARSRRAPTSARGVGAGAAATPPKWRLPPEPGRLAGLRLASRCCSSPHGARVIGADGRQLRAARASAAISPSPRSTSRSTARDEVADAPARRRDPRRPARAAGIDARRRVERAADRSMFGRRAGRRGDDRGRAVHRGARRAAGSPSIIAARPELFAPLACAIGRGRAFTDRDDAGAPRVAVVSERLARDVFQTDDVVGRTVLLGRRRAAPSSRAAAFRHRDGDRSSASRRDLGRRRRRRLAATRSSSSRWAQRYEPRRAGRGDRRAGRSPRRGRRRPARRRSAASIRSWRRARSAPARALLRGAVLPRAHHSRPGHGARRRSRWSWRWPASSASSHTSSMRRTREMGIRHRARRRSRADLPSDPARRDAAGREGARARAGHRRRRAPRACAAWVVTDDQRVRAAGVRPACRSRSVVAALVACYLPAARASRVDPNVALRDL